jgi:hypothetical protein
MKKIILFSIIAASTAFTSCNDLLEPAIENHRQIDDMYFNPTFAQGLMNQVYILMPYSNSSVSDVATDDAVTNDRASNYMRMATGSWASDMDPMSQWQNRYNAINYLNIMLENSDMVEWVANNKALTAMYNDQYKGEAYALRALHYYFLMRAHAGKTADGRFLGVPLFLKGQDAETPQEELNKARNTFKECYDQMMADVNKAIELLPVADGDIASDNDVPAKYKQMGGTAADYNRAFGNHQIGKITSPVAEAIRAQIAFMAASPAFSEASGVTWAQAADFLAVSLDRIGGVSGIDPDGWKWFTNTSFIDNMKQGEMQKEVLWRGNRRDSESSIEKDCFPPSIYGNGRINPTQNLVDAFPMANGYPITEAASNYNPQDPYADRDPRLATYILLNESKMGVEDKTIVTGVYGTNRDALNRDNGSSTRTGYYLRKGLRSDVNLNPSSTVGKSHYTPRIRFTELFLDYAEAANEAWGPTGKGTHNYSAKDIVKAIRSRAGVGGDDDPYLELCAANKEKMRELIRNERRLELCFENQRFYDLRRWNVNLNKLNETAQGMQIDKLADGTLTYTVLPSVEVRNYKNYMYYGPIPFVETRKYNALEQNEGWR